jgi:cob(I)alamin adenosyltransferase
MKIYTKHGDDGGTALFGGGRVAKDDVRIEAYGTLDELSAHLGLVRSQTPPDGVEELLQAIQSDLFVLGAQLAAPTVDRPPAGALADKDVERLERAIDAMEANLAPLRNFIVPGGSPVAAALHVARVVCRRAERRLVTLGRQAALPDSAIPYLNRLSDLLFVLARFANAHDAIPDLLWRPPA